METRKCWACGERMVVGLEFCPQCGESTTRPVPPVHKETHEHLRDRIAADPEVMKTAAATKAGKGKK